MPIPRMLVPAPPRKPRKYGLFSVAPPKDQNDGSHWSAGIEMEADDCFPSWGSSAAVCEPLNPRYSTDEDGRQVTSFDAVNFYVQNECRAVGEWDLAQDRVIRNLSDSEEYAAENYFWNSSMVDLDTVQIEESPVAVDPLQALARLEEFASSNILGQATFHAPVALATYLVEEASVKAVGNHLETPLGNPLIAGAGYGSQAPGGLSVPFGINYLMVTGPVHVWRGQRRVYGPVMNEDPRDNTTIAVAERTYVLGHECQAAVIPVLLYSSSAG